MSSRQLIEQARAGDPTAREQLAEFLRERIRRTAGHYAGRTGLDREDLQQEMWLGVLAGLQQVDLSIGDPVHYLLLRGKWRLLETIRRSAREPALPLDPDLTVVEKRSFEDEVCLRQLLHQLLGDLRGTQKAVLQGLLRGHRQEELATQLGCTTANVSYHVRKIREGYLALLAESRAT